MSTSPTVFVRQYFHGTRAELTPGALIVVGHASNFRAGSPLSWVYLSATLDAAIWGAELALGDGPGRIYVVEPTGAIVDDPNVTDKKFPGNPTLSYRSREPLRVVGEIMHWEGHPADQVRQMKEHLDRMKADGVDLIID